MKFVSVPVRLVLLLLVSCQLGRCQVQAFNCYDDCTIEAASLPAASCEQIIASTDCYSDNVHICMTENEVEAVIIGIFGARGVCEMPECPSVPSFTFGAPDTSSVLESADITPEPHSCRMDPAPTTMRQCSMFAYSHLRPFEGYRTGLETCTVPGQWYLINHPELTVIVESESVSDSSTLTQLTMVNITFSPSPCSGEAPLSYVATNSASLPLTLTDGRTLDNSNSPLQLKSSTTSANSSVVSLLAVWINTTIIIRRHNDVLSVTVYIPGDMSFYSEGLCRGCPRHAYFNVTAFNSQVATRCSSSNYDAIFQCFVHSELVDQIQFNDITNNTYVEHCQFNLYKKESLNALSIMRSVGQDARLLPDIGFVPIIVEPPPPSPSPGTYPNSSPTIIVETSTDRVETTTTASATTTDNDFFSSASSLSQLNFVTVLLCVLVTCLFR